MGYNYYNKGQISNQGSHYFYFPIVLNNRPVTYKIFPN